MFLYNVAIRLYVLVVYLVSPFNTKARKLIAGRRNFFKIHQPDPSIQFIWFHCASLGEFEQARPLIEKIKAEQPHRKILLSFFSSSGYEIRKNYPLADKVIYLPFDFATNTNKFFGTFNISLAVFVKYDVWPNYLQELLNRKIPVILTSATFRADQFYFKSYGKFLLGLLKKMNKIYVQNTESLNVLHKNGFENVVQCGDVRVDRVVQIKSNNERLLEVEKFIGSHEAFIFGSVYASEVDLIHQLVANTHYKIIIAPHNIGNNNIQFFSTQFPKSILISDFSNYLDQRVLIIDNIGMLNKMYRYASGVYIGGGFGKGIHNILEPGVWGVPVYFGPVFSKFPEADAFIRAKMAFSEKNPSDLAKIMCYNAKDLNLNEFKELSKNWFSANSGATELIYSDLASYI